jgi:hypothetical protein
LNENQQQSAVSGINNPGFVYVPGVPENRQQNNVSGAVVGTTGSTDSNIVEYSGLTGLRIKDGGLSHANVLDAITLKHSNAGKYRYAAAMADTTTITLPTITVNYPAHGFIHCAHASTGVISESAEFEFGSTGAVQIIRGSANIEANGATAGKISLGAAVSANPVVIKNNLGGGVSVNVLVNLDYN